jgi:hypothetical protein
MAPYPGAGFHVHGAAGWHVFDHAVVISGPAVAGIGSLFMCAVAGAAGRNHGSRLLAVANYTDVFRLAW